MRFLFIIFIFISAGLNSQVWHKKKAIPFRTPVDLVNADFPGFVSFSGEMKLNSDVELPTYNEVLLWDKPCENLKFDIISPVFEAFGGVIADSSILSSLADSVFYNFSIEYMQKKPYLQMMILPFRRNSETGRIERLRSFVLKIENIPVPSAKSSGVKKSGSPDNSVLASGKWFKIRVPSAGIYKLTFDQINAMSVGDPGNVRIFGFGGEVLPEDFKKGEKDDLQPIQIYMSKGTDGVFNSGDYILFYSRGSVRWSYDAAMAMFRQQINPYSDFSYYFVTSGAAPDFPVNDDVPVSDPDKFSNTYDYRDFHEKEIFNALLSGKQWFGEDFSTQVQQTFNFTIPGIVLDQPVEIIGQVMAKSTQPSQFQLTYNNKIIDTYSVLAANLSDYTSTFGYTQLRKISITSLNNEVSLKLKYIKPELSASGWLDYFTINARSALQMQSDMLAFRDINTTSTGSVTQFTLSAASSNTLVWDVTNQNDIRSLSGTLNGSQLIFKTNTGTLREFVAFNRNGSFPSPEIQGKGLGIIPSQNIHGSGQPDMVIISHPDFLSEAERLATYRHDISGFDVLLVTSDQVFNEFSSGAPDVSAYRNMMKMFYERAGSDSALLPRYLLLFGDGTFDNKGISDDATNFILTYQSDNSLSPTSSYVSDDYFGLLDPAESMTSGLLDIGIGRLPAGSLKEAEELVSKIINYEKPDRMGDWRNTLCFIGDDEDGNVHINDADGLATYVETNYPGFNLNKIYLDAYKQVTTPVGQKYPDVNIAIGNQVNRGALIINYTGHGGTAGWAHEQILDINEIDSWTNKYRLPLFMTATCEFSRYDDHKVLSAGEKVLLNPDGGGIALLTTTRLVYSQPNRILNEKFYEIVFEKDGEGKNYCLGDIMQYTKNKTGAGVNKRNFTLLGDPSMRLSYPQNIVLADSLNGRPISDQPDTLNALRKIVISGHIENIKGQGLNDFNGTIYPTVYDKALTLQTLANDGGSKKSFTLRNSILYKGKTTVGSGYFTFSFVVPKDISYSFGGGRLSFYAEDSVTDACGANSDIIIGGSFSQAETDTDGPEIKVFMNSSTFRSGGITDENPILYVEVKDENGVNTTGNGIGHDISAVLDDNYKKTFVMNEYYQSYNDSYQGGLISYPLSKLEPGPHSVTVKVWDIFNNSSTGSTDFVVIKSEDLVLENLLNYPNPFRDYTNISFSHNKPGIDMDITVDIINMEGGIISTIKAKETNTGFRSQNIYWDGKGAQNGQSVYIYRIRVETSDGQKAEKSGKLIVTH